MIAPKLPLAPPRPSSTARRGGEQGPATDADAAAVGDAVAEAVTDAVSEALGERAAGAFGETVGEAVADAVMDGNAHERATDVAEAIAVAAASSADRSAASALTAALIEGIVVSTDVDLIAGTESFDNTLLLKDGRAWTGLAGSPLTLVPPPPGEAYGAGWTLWRHAADDSGRREVLDAPSGLWKRLIGRLIEPSVDTASNLSGHYSRSLTHVAGTTTTTRHDSLRLALDGTFSRTASVFVTAATPRLSGVGVPTTVHVPETASDPGRLGGRYALLQDGYTLELTYTDGSSEHRLLLDDGDERVLDNRRHRFAGDDIDAIDLLAIARSWAAGRRDVADWRAVIAEAAARDVEDRALSNTDTPLPRGEADPKP